MWFANVNCHTPYTTGGAENSEPELYRHHIPRSYAITRTSRKRMNPLGECLATVAFDESFFPVASSGLAARQAFGGPAPPPDFRPLAKNTKEMAKNMMAKPNQW